MSQLEFPLRGDSYPPKVGREGQDSALCRANLLGANLTGANITGAFLAWANLVGANIAGVIGKPASGPF